MIGIENFAAFLATAFLFIMTPGIDTVFVINKTIAQGRKPGLYASLGVNSGILVHTLLAALGLSVLVAQSEMAFKVISYLGAAYIIYLGATQLFPKKQTATSTGHKKKRITTHSNFMSGFITNTLNPKVALFFLAFFPQFITPTELENPMPFVVLGLTYALLGTVWYISLTCFANTFSNKMKSGGKLHQRMQIGSGIIFIAMGIQIAFSS
ncbi:LysE family translocator [uncultured Marixanthomonas sp.]|uniref:LysE family translocator n=1 Tax=uncultured Marixanthomonas sp. TaxID=757245 RepID=UPI0030D9C790|tara:strand:+ start:100332 stop:100961 length:630 start_codon:yes stop_codon:yes gene_type:complete